MSVQANVKPNDPSLSSLGVSFLVTPDPDRRIIKIGTNIKELLSYTQEECCEGSVTMGQLVHPDDRVRLQNRLQEAARGNVAYKTQYRLQSRDGEWVHVLEIGRPRWQGEDSLAGFAGILFELRSTSPEALGTKADQLEAMAEVSNRIAHDFNNILSVLISNLDLMRRYSDPTSKSHRWLERALKASERGEQYTQELLSFARRKHLPGSLLDLNMCVTETVRQFRTAFDSQGIHLTLSLADDLAPVEGDSADLISAMGQVFQNAIDALPEGGQVRIRTRTTSTGTITLEVLDSGEGMQGETLERCILPFFTTHQDGLHVGLGLTKATGTVRRLGGDLRVSSEVGVGTAVLISLPTKERLA